MKHKVILLRMCEICENIFEWPKRAGNRGRYCGYNCRQKGNARVSVDGRAERMRKRTSGKWYVKLKSDHEHRVVMAHYIGRKLTSVDIIHHKNGNIKDNRIENLELMTRSEHIREHLPEMHRRMLKKHGVYFIQHKKKGEKLCYTK